MVFLRGNMTIFFDTIKACVSSTVDCGHKIVSNVKATEYLAEFLDIFLRASRENNYFTGTGVLIHACSEVKKWTAVTKFFPYAQELTSGDAAGPGPERRSSLGNYSYAASSPPGRESRRFFGTYNYPKVFSRLCLTAHSFFHSAQVFFHWGLIAQKTATFLSFGLEGAALQKASFTLGVAGWASDFVDATSRLYEEGLSLHGAVIFTHDLATLASLAISRLSFVPQVVRRGVDMTAALLGILRELVNDPKHLHAFAVAVAVPVDVFYAVIAFLQSVVEAVVLKVTGRTAVRLPMYA